MAVLQNVMGSGIQHTTKRITHFRQVGIWATSSSIAPIGGNGVSGEAVRTVFGSVVIVNKRMDLYNEKASNKE